MYKRACTWSPEGMLGTSRRWKRRSDLIRLFEVSRFATPDTEEDAIEVEEVVEREGGRAGGREGGRKVDREGGIEGGRYKGERERKNNQSEKENNSV